MAAADRPVPGTDRRPGRLPLPRRRAHPRRGAGPPARRATRPGRARGRAARRGVSGVHDVARLARLRRREGRPARARRPWPTDSPDQTQGRRPTSTTTCGGCGSRGGRRRRSPDRGGRQPASGVWPRRSLDAALAGSTRTGSRSRPAPTTSSGTRRSARRGGRIRVATGEHVHNRVVFKQLLQADAIDVVQIDACRVGGVNENVAILLLAAEFGMPVCPHAGGVGLCELVRHLSFFDFVAVRHPRRSDDRVRGPPSRALHRPGGGLGRPLCRTDPARLFGPHARGLRGPLPATRRAPPGRPESCARPRWTWGHLQ